MMSSRDMSILSAMAGAESGPRHEPRASARRYVTSFAAEGSGRFRDAWACLRVVGARRADRAPGRASLVLCSGRTLTAAARTPAALFVLVARAPTEGRELREPGANPVHKIFLKPYPTGRRKRRE
ncbi:anaphase-promoting complex subunit 11 isoform X1 [Notamacropus eugenii]|uniref:anaphase-promoting complex subunit 11 isoform X1 n=1 Tax=Notamacropus eugenii TaxID=9315 RepID=UPI003B676DF5